MVSPAPVRAAISPGGAGAKARDLSRLEGFDGTRRWHHAEANVASCFQAGGGQPVAQQQIVTGIGVDDAKRQRFIAAAKIFGKGLHNAQAAILGQRPHRPRQFARQGDGVAAERNAGWNQQRLADTAQPQLDRESQRRQDDGGIQKAIGQLVGDIGPGGFGDQFGVQAFFRKPAELVRDNGRRGIGQAQEADAQSGVRPPAFEGNHVTHGFLSRFCSSCAATKSATIWASLRLSFMAFFRSQR